MRNAMRRIQTSIFGIQRPERGQRMKLNFSKCDDNVDDNDNVKIMLMTLKQDNVDIMLMMIKQK